MLPPHDQAADQAAMIVAACLPLVQAWMAQISDETPDDRTVFRYTAHGHDVRLTAGAIRAAMRAVRAASPVTCDGERQTAPG